jgi:hypothetical protein
MVATGTTGDEDRDGLLDARIELVSLELRGPIAVYRFDRESIGSLEELRPGQAYPANSDLRFSYVAHLPNTVFSTRTGLEALIQEWPPFGQTYANPSPSAVLENHPFELLKLTFLPVDADADGLPDHYDPDDDAERFPVLADFGDAPDPSYPTLLANNGAHHIIIPGFHLGVAVDPEPDGQPDAAALGDDNNADDEDGVTLGPFVQGQTVAAQVLASVAGMLDAWVDFNADGDWNEPDEKIFNAQPLVAGPNNLSFQVPATATLGNTYARFRFSSAGSSEFFGQSHADCLSSHPSRHLLVGRLSQGRGLYPQL